MNELSPRLKSGQISPLGLAALAIGIMSPAMGLFALWGPMQASAGPITPLVFLGAAAVAMPTAISYAVLNREAPSAGAASTWLWRAVSPAAGYLVGLTMSAYFVLAALVQPLLFALFFRDLALFLGLPDWGTRTLVLGLPICILPTMWVTYRGAAASTRLAVTLMTIETIVVLVLSATILSERHAVPGGIDLMAFNPMAASHGIRGYWMAMLLGILGYAGFDVISTAAEETKAPREHMPRAIILTILGIAVFWAVNAWVFTLGMPNTEVVAYSKEGLTTVTPLAHKYWGDGNIVVILTAFSGVLAVSITGALGASRILFALARHRLLPASLARLEPDSRVPRRSLHVVFAIVAIGDLVLLLLLPNGLDAFNWSANALVFFASLTFASVNVANVFYFRRTAPARFSVGSNLIVPVIGATSTLYVLYEMFFVALWNGDWATGRSVVMFASTLFVVFLLVVALTAVRTPQKLQGVAPMEADPREADSVGFGGDGSAAAAD